MHYFQIEYEDLNPIIITIEDAIKHNSFFDDEFNLKIEKGNVDKVFQEAENIIQVNITNTSKGPKFKFLFIDFVTFYFSGRK